MASPAKLSRFIFKVFFFCPSINRSLFSRLLCGLAFVLPLFFRVNGHSRSRNSPFPVDMHRWRRSLQKRENSTRRRGRRVLECFFVLVRCAWSFSSKFLAPTFDKLSYFTLWLKLRNIGQTFLFFLRETAMSSCSPSHSFRTEVLFHFSCQSRGALPSAYRPSPGGENSADKMKVYVVLAIALVVPLAAAASGASAADYRAAPAGENEVSQVGNRRRRPVLTASAAEEEEGDRDVRFKKY